MRIVRRGKFLRPFLSRVQGPVSGHPRAPSSPLRSSVDRGLWNKPGTRFVGGCLGAQGPRKERGREADLSPGRSLGPLPFSWATLFGTLAFSNHLGQEEEGGRWTVL